MDSVATQFASASSPVVIPAQATAEWVAALGSPNVIESQSVRSEYGKDCGFSESVPGIVLRPATIDELREIIRIARKYLVPLHPSSRGKNWGYGSASPVYAGTAVVDLCRMNRIVEINEELAYAVVEPGVTQQQLFDELQRRGGRLVMDVTGSSPHASLLGNLTERGYGQTPYGDHFLHSSGMEVILADGTVLKTGFGHYERCQTQYLYKWGIGPYLDGLFTQSNLGIVTKVGIWLMPRPEMIGLLTVPISSDEQMVKVAPILRDLRLRGILTSTVHVSNDIRLISCFSQFPYSLTSGNTALRSDYVRKLREQFEVSAWNCFTSLRGSKREVSAALCEVREALRGVAKASFVTNRSVQWADRLGVLYRYLTGVSPERVRMLYRLVSGAPTEGPSLGAYWRHRTVPASAAIDPARDGAGIAWVAPILPNTSTDVRNFLRLVRATMDQFEFETNLTLTQISERALCATIAIAYDKSCERDRALECYDAMLQRTVQAGYVPYRHGTNVDQARDVLFRDGDPFWQICRTLKNALDPWHIFSPGRYGII
jgi:4-cresol dehydrogenase (hydroxylating) flavoprotein subunit